MRLEKPGNNSIPNSRQDTAPRVLSLPRVHLVVERRVARRVGALERRQARRERGVLRHDERVQRLVLRDLRGQRGGRGRAASLEVRNAAVLRRARGGAAVLRNRGRRSIPLDLGSCAREGRELEVASEDERRAQREAEEAR